ncbi:MAG TPA: hypothetical protein VI172_12760 [Candidatus Dormibacteraeota bacterium]|jgi:hypothetical protein
MPTPHALEPRRQEGGADVASLVALGRADPPPTPRPPHEPARPPVPEPPPVPADPADEAVLNAALLDAGLSVDTEDAAAVKSIAALDSATVAVVAKWVKAKKKDNSPPK